MPGGLADVDIGAPAARLRRMKPLSFLVLVLAAGACGGGGQPDSVLALCEAGCDRHQRCQSNPDESREDCLADCVDNAPRESIFKPGLLSTWAACLSKLECGVGDDQCLLEVVVAQDPNWETNPKHQACLARAQACGVGPSGDSISDDACVVYFLSTPAVGAQVDACLSEACATIGACLDTVLQQ